jgi:hypothetical protein
MIDAIIVGKLTKKPVQRTGNSDNCEPLYNMGNAFKRLGIDPDEMPEHLKRHVHSGNVNRAH